MVQKTRFLLNNNNLIKKFIYILPYQDGSISVGSSLPLTKEMKIGKINIPRGKEGKIRVNFQDALSIKPDLAHFSFHPSYKSSKGEIHLKTSKGKYLFKYKISRFTGENCCKKIMTILPKNPDDYPVMQTKITPNDLILPIGQFDNKPFSVEIFLCQKNLKYKKAFDTNKSFHSCILALCENKDYILIVKLIRKFETDWPRYTVFIPYTEGLDISV